LGHWISGGDRGGYQYLVESVEAFGPPAALLRALDAAGLGSVRVEPLPGRIAALFTGRKPLDPEARDGPD
jgi:ubiquinone/menaquinone biosynthesis C-methylase UbiE